METPGSIKEVVSGLMSENRGEVADAVTFIEAPWGLGVRLLPVQRFILKCASGDNLIAGHDGVHCSLREFYETRQPTVATFDERDGSVKRVRHVGVTPGGVKPVYRLTTRLSKRWIELTGDHLVLTPFGYRRLDELSPGDSVVAVSDEPFPEPSSDLTDCVAKIEAVGEKDVYDIAVPVTHNFVIGGLVVHNCFYGLHLDDGQKSISIPDVVNDRILYEFTEAEFLSWLHDHGRCNTSEIEGKNFRELVMVAGRRASKSTLAACISCYELYRLVKLGNPHKHFDVVKDSPIAVLNVAPSDGQADIVFGMMEDMTLGCAYLGHRVVNKTLKYYNLQTDVDINSGNKKRASLIALAGGSASNSVRGHSAIVVILDELAHFVDNGGRFSGSAVYHALTPSIIGFGEEGKIVSLSSPYGKYGVFWDRYQESFEEKDTTLMFKMYSAMVNPKVDSTLLKVERRRDRVNFMCEYGGEFSDEVMAWVDDESEFRRCIDDGPVVRPARRGDVHYMGIDVGLKNDGTAISVVHRDGGKIVLDWANVWYSGSSNVWDVESSPYHSHDCRRYADGELLRMSDIVTEIKTLCRMYNVVGGIFDQHMGYGLLELLEAAGLKQFDIEHFNDALNHEVYDLLKTLYLEQLIVLSDHPILVPEVLGLERHLKGKARTLVCAPGKRGAHDDLADAWARAVWLCYQNARNKPQHVTALSNRRGGGVPASGTTNGHMRRLEQIKMHGPHPRTGSSNVRRRAAGAVSMPGTVRSGGR